MHGLCSYGTRRSNLRDVGTLYNPEKLKYAAGSYFDMSGEESTLELFWPSPSEDDIRKVQYGRATFGLWYSNYGDVYFLYHFEDDPWSDSVFSTMQLAPEKRIRPPKIYGHKRLNLDITLVDADSGIVRATRQVSLSVSFSRKMCASVNRQFSERYLASWNLEDFQKRCREIYAEYPQSVDITRAPGCIICQAPEIQPFYLEEKNVQM